MGSVLLRIGAYWRLIGNQGLIVAFHRVNDRTAGDGLTVGVDAFEEFCGFFRNYFDVVPLAEFICRLSEGRPLGGALAITFDDGYLDNFEIARPILLSHGLPATFFITSGFMGSTIVPWWDSEISPPPAWMQWDQVVQLHRDGFDIGGHTRTHVDLGRVATGEAQAEIAGGRADLAQQIGRAPDHFAFPYGGPQNLREDNRTIVQTAGFRCCVSCHGGTVRPGADPYRLHRVPISAWFQTPEQFAYEVMVGKV